MYFHYELEMAQPGYALAMTGPGDDFAELPRFAEALRMIDQVLDEDENADSVRTLVDGTWTDVDMSALREAVRRKCATDTMAEVRNGTESARLAMVDIPSLQEATPKEIVQTPCEAVEAAVEMVPVAALQGRVSGEYVYSYPPGIPLLVPGERITEAMVRYLQQADKRYDELRYSRSEAVHGRVACLRYEVLLLSVIKTYKQAVNRWRCHRFFSILRKSMRMCNFLHSCMLSLYL